MIQNNNFNNNNNNLRNQGHPWQMVSDINQEVQTNLNNLDNLNSQQQNQLNQINNSISNLSTQIENERNNNTKTNETLYKYEDRFVTNEEKIKQHDEFVLKLKRESFDYLGEYYDNMAEGYCENNILIKGMKHENSKWLSITTAVFFLILIVNIVAILIVIFNESITKNDIFYAIPVEILLSVLLYFSASQYSYYKRLYMEYKNRSVVAKTYLSLLNGNTNQEERNIITKIVADTLFSRNVTDQGAELPIKEVTKIAEKILTH